MPSVALWQSSVDNQALATLCVGGAYLCLVDALKKCRYRIPDEMTQVEWNEMRHDIRVAAYNLAELLGEVPRLTAQFPETAEL